MNGSNEKPALSTTASNAASEAAVKAWNEADSKVSADLILSINPSADKGLYYVAQGLAQTGGHLLVEGARQESKLTKATYTAKNAGRKLRNMDIEINEDLLSIMLLYSLPNSFENFCVAIESRDDLTTSDILRIKIIEESDARKSVDVHTKAQHALIASKFSKDKNYLKKYNSENVKSESEKNRLDTDVTGADVTRQKIARIRNQLQIK